MTERCNGKRGGGRNCTLNDQHPPHGRVSGKRDGGLLATCAERQDEFSHRGPAFLARVNGADLIEREGAVSVTVNPFDAVIKIVPFPLGKCCGVLEVVREGGWCVVDVERGIGTLIAIARGVGDLQGEPTGVVFQDGNVDTHMHPFPSPPRFGGGFGRV